MKTFKWLFLFYLIGINVVAFLFGYISSHNETSILFLNETTRSLIFSALGGNIGTLSFLYFVEKERVGFTVQIILWLTLVYQILFAIWVSCLFKKKKNTNS